MRAYSKWQWMPCMRRGWQASEGDGLMALREVLG